MYEIKIEDIPLENVGIESQNEEYNPYERQQRELTKEGQEEKEFFLNIEKKYDKLNGIQRISNLIEDLEQLKEKYGNIPVQSYDGFGPVFFEKFIYIGSQNEEEKRLSDEQAITLHVSSW